MIDARGIKVTTSQVGEVLTGVGMVRRRTLLGSALTIVLAPQTVKAEKVWRIAFFSVAAGPNYLADAFAPGLHDLSSVEGRNLVIDYRWMAGREQHYRDVTRELSDGRVDLIVTAGHPPALAAKSATSHSRSSIPWGLALSAACLILAGTSLVSLWR